MTTLKYFDTHKEVTTHVGIFKNELAYSLIQDGEPIVYTLKVLADTKNRYANI